MELRLTVVMTIAITVATLSVVIGFVVAMYSAHQLRSQRDQVYQLLLDEKKRSQTLHSLLVKAVDGFAPGLTEQVRTALEAVRLLHTPEGRMESVKQAFQSLRFAIQNRCSRAKVDELNGNDKARQGMCDVINYYFSLELLTLDGSLNNGLAASAVIELKVEFQAVRELLWRGGVAT